MWPFKQKVRTAPTPGMTREQALACAVRVNSDVTTTERNDGPTRLTYYATARPMFAKTMRRMGAWDGKPLKKELELDEMGTLVWGWIDGHRTVQELVDLLGKEFQLHPREAEVAMTGFLRELGKRGIVGFD